MNTSRIYIVLGFLFLFPVVAKAQHKFEREYNIKSEMIPQSAKEFINSIGFDSVSLGEYKNFGERTYQTTDYLFDVTILKDSIKTFYLKVQCKENMQVPIAIGTRISVMDKIVSINIASGIYFGIMIVMILYNLFVYFTLKDSSYIWYSFYIILILLTQTSLQGYTFQYLWPNSPLLAIYSPFFLPASVGIIGLEFFKHFLKIKERIPMAYKISLLFLIPYALSFVLAFFDQFKTGDLYVILIK